MSEMPSTDAVAREAIRGLSKLWWLWLVFGVAWVVAGLVILQFNDASITTVGWIFFSRATTAVCVFPNSGAITHPTPTLRQRHRTG